MGSQTSKTVAKAVEAIREGKMVIVVDDERRENEGDLVIAAEKITAEDINFMVEHGRGQITTPVDPDRLEELNLPLQTADAADQLRPALTVTADLRRVIPRGVSTSFT